MPEVSEVRLMMETISTFLTQPSSKISNIEVRGGRYFAYHQLDPVTHQWVHQTKNLKTGRLVSIKPPKSHQNVSSNNGKFLPILENLDDFNTVAHRLVGPVKINTRGKLGWIELGRDPVTGDEWILEITFGMSGSIRVGHQDDPQVVFHVSDADGGTQKEFHFVDPRRFGTLTLSKSRQHLDAKLSRLGIDLLKMYECDQYPLDFMDNSPHHEQMMDYIMCRIRYSKYAKMNICKLLMSQDIIAGVGNYLKAEGLYASRIHPLATVNNLSNQNLIELIQHLHRIAKSAYEARGASLYTYVNSTGEQGQFQTLLSVYGRANDPDGLPVSVISEKDSPDGRTTHYVQDIQLIGMLKPESAVKTPTPTPTLCSSKIFKIKKLKSLNLNLS
jgi:formamidopyrimidine-DNA glycosylase